MTWEYALIGLIVGFIIGALVVRYGNPKSPTKTAQAELDKKVLNSKSTVKNLLAILLVAQNYWIKWRAITASFTNTWHKFI